MNRQKLNHGGARKGAGRKKGIGIDATIQKHCAVLIENLLKDDAIRSKAISQLSIKYDKDEEGYLYVISSSDGYKIGFSTNIKQRLKHYKTNLLYYNVTFIYKGVEAFELESKFHKMYEAKRIKGEWFRLEKRDLLQIVSICSKCYL